MTWWHGGPAIRGDKVLPFAGECRSGEPDGWVYLSPLRSLALMYAVSCGGWLYEVLPVGDVEQDPGSILEPGESMRCREATIVRRFRPSRTEVDAALSAMDV